MYWAVITEGDDAPRFELPALVDGEHRRVELGEYLEEDVIILAFYPGDFNPACDEESDLDELDLFTMQKDVSVLGISADSLYSHAALATEYALHIPLLSDTRRRVAQQYGVTFEDDVGQELIERAAFVVDHDGEVQYAWSTREMTELPDVDAIKDAIAETGGDDTAFARYRVGYAHYTEGRRAFTSAMGSYQDSEWMLSQSDFKRAQEEFEEAAEHFDSAVRFVEDADIAAYYEQAEEKATALWQAAEWLTQSASEYSSGAGAEGQQLRDDAERPLQTARDIGDPIDPDDWPPDLDADDGGESILPQNEDADTELSVDIDEAADAADDSADSTVAADASAEEPAPDQPADGDGEGEFDDEELEEIEAELTANQPENPVGEEIEASPTSMVDAPPGVDDADEPDDGEIDEDDLAELEADMAASQSAAEAPAEDEGDDEIDDERSDTDLRSDSGDGSETTSPDDAEVPPPGSGALEPARDDGSDDPAGQRSDDGSGPNPFEAAASAGTVATGEGDDTAESEANVDDRDEGESADDELGEPEGASDEEMAEIPAAEELEAPDGASDEDMAAIPTEDELDEERDDDGASADERE